MKIRKLLSALLCLCLLCALLPVGAAAAGERVSIAGVALNSTTPYYINDPGGHQGTIGNAGEWNAYFDAANSTLHLKNLNVTSNTANVIEVTNISTLYIELEGSNTVTSENDDTTAFGISAPGTTKLVIYSKDSNTGNSLTVNANNGTGISVDSAGSIELQYPATLTVKGAEKAANQAVRYISSAYDATGGDDVAVTPSEDYNSAHIPTATAYKHIVFSLKSTPKFPVYVGDTPVTSSNMNNVLGGGTVIYTPAHGSTPAKLTLNGASITLSTSRGLYAAGIYAEYEPLTIHLIGTNTVEVQYSSTYTCGVYSEKALTITAEAGATLTASAEIIGNSGTTYAIHSSESITLDHCEITAPAGATLLSGNKIIDDNDTDLQYSTATIGTPVITIRRSATESFDVTVTLTDSIENIKAKIQQQWGDSPDRQKLSYHGTPLDAGHTLAEYSIPYGATLDLTVTPVYAPSYYTLSFVTNGGGDLRAVTRVESSSVDLAAYVPVREGCVFAGWYADEALTTPVERVTLRKNTAVYAGWTWTNPYADVQADDWFYDDVAYASMNGLFAGLGGGAFAPQAPMTRGMFVTVLWRLAGRPTMGAGKSGTFPDVAENRWYTEAVEWAAASGITGGYDGGTFGPGDSITRQQLTAMLFRFARWAGHDVSVGEDTNILSYNDAFDVSEYAIPAFQWACGAGLIHGDAGSLLPWDDASRAQTAALLRRFCEA